QQAGFGRLLEVKVERLGKCAEQPKPFVTGSKRPPASPQPDYASQRPNTFDYLDHGLANTATTTRPSPIFLPEPPKIFQQSTDQEAIQQPASTQTQQRTFLLTTLLPICIIIVILLA
ncbi:unnamed protein product, partial [Hymenolepis diminuta]